MEFAEYLARTYGVPLPNFSREWIESQQINSNINDDVYDNYSTAPSVWPTVDPRLTANTVIMNNDPAPIPNVVEEITDLDSIPESDHDPALPIRINDIRVTSNPHSAQIESILDSVCKGPKRQIFYLAKTKKENYYWFCSPRTDKDLRFNRLIGDYQYKTARKGNKKVRVGKRLRNGKTIMS